MDNLVGGFIGFLFWCFVELIGSLVARLAIPLLSFGRAYVSPFGSPRQSFNWLGYRRDESGRIEVADDIAGYIGLGICFALVLVFVVFVRVLS